MRVMTGQASFICRLPILAILVISFWVIPGSKGIGVATAATNGPSLPVATNLVTNGSFEDPTPVDATFSENASIPGWTLCYGSAIEIDADNNFGPRMAENGSQVTELNSDSPSAICQNVPSLVSGHTYKLSFWYSPRPGSPSSSNEMNVLWNGSPLNNSVITASGFEADGTTPLATTSWTQYTFTVTASADTNTLEFIDVGAPLYNGCACGSVLDNVQLFDTTPTFSPTLDGQYTNMGTAANPLDLTGTAVPGTSVSVYEDGSCPAAGVTENLLGSTTADSVTGGWEIPLTNVSVTSHTYVVQSTDGNNVYCSAPATFTVDRTAPASNITSPGVYSDNSASAWSSGCTPVGICGMASDDSSGVGAVYVSIMSIQGPTSGELWNGSSFQATPVWLSANVSNRGGTRVTWNYPMALPADGQYVAVSAAIDDAGNAETGFLYSESCASTSSDITFAVGGSPTYSGGGSPVYSGGGSGTTCLSGGSGSPVYSGGGSPVYSGGGSPTYSGGGSPVYSGGGTGTTCPSGGSGSLTYSGGGSPVYSGGGSPVYSGGGTGACNLLSFQVDTTPPTTSSITVDGQTLDGSVNIDPNSTLHVQFDEAMNTSTLNGTSISLSPSAGTPTFDSLGEGVDITGLQPATFYTLTINGGMTDATDLAGNPAPTTYFHFTTAATSPLSGTAAADTDGDGIPNGYDGASFTVNGQTINTSAWGFLPNHKDVCLVENYMTNGTTVDQHITQQANQDIVNAFANAPVTNPDGTNGIHLVIFEGPQYSAGLPAGYSGPYYGGPIGLTPYLGLIGTGGFEWNASYDAGANSASFDSIRNTNFVPTGLSQICHYAVIAHQISNTAISGSARGIPSSDIVIALGTTKTGTGTLLEQQGTVMHELGHNLGLHHGGAVPPCIGSSCPALPSDIDTNNKPNYLSVMNYSFQFSGVPGGTAANGLDYSRSALPSLNKSNLNVAAGLGSGATGFGTTYFCPGTTSGSEVGHNVAVASGPIDWGCTGATSGTVSADINGDGVSNEVLNGYNDWANLSYTGGVLGEGADTEPVHTPEFPATDIDVSTTESGGTDSATRIESLPFAPLKFTGFLSPLNSDTTGTIANVGKAGKTYPVKFQLQDGSGNTVNWLNAVTSVLYSPVSSGTADGSTTIAYATTSSAGLHYDSTANQYVYNWQTPSTPGTYMLTITLSDNHTYKALFQLN